MFSICLAENKFMYLTQAKKLLYLTLAYHAMTSCSSILRSTPALMVHFSCSSPLRLSHEKLMSPSSKLLPFLGWLKTVKGEDLVQPFKCCCPRYDWLWFQSPLFPLRFTFTNRHIGHTHVTLTRPSQEVIWQTSKHVHILSQMST